MDQKKIGAFLKRLRKEKGLTQEQLAERFYVSSKTVSRWETGSNMPDVGTLIDLADFYDVDIRELIDGERKSEMMDKETKDTLKKGGSLCQRGRKTSPVQGDEHRHRCLYSRARLCNFVRISVHHANRSAAFGFCHWRRMRTGVLFADTVVSRKNPPPNRSALFRQPSCPRRYGRGPISPAAL